MPYIAIEHASTKEKRSENVVTTKTSIKSNWVHTHSTMPSDKLVIQGFKEKGTVKYSLNHPQEFPDCELLIVINP